MATNTDNDISKAIEIVKLDIMENKVKLFQEKFIRFKTK